MQVLIIGGTRFVGYFLVWRLLAGGHQVTLLNRGSAPDPFGGAVQRVIGDRTQPGTLSLLGNRAFDAVVDFAAYDRPDVESVVDVLRSRVGHYLFISTGQVYLVRKAVQRPTPESAYDGPLLDAPADAHDREEWQYGIRKRACEDVLAAAWRDEGFPSTRLRIPMVNGERDFHRRIESYVWRILDGKPLALPPGANQPLRHIYSGSLVTAIADQLGNRETFGNAYNLAQDETPSLRQLLELLAEILGAPARLQDVTEADLRRAGLRATDLSPFSGRWMSFLDPTLSRQELGFRHEPLRSYLEKTLVSLLASPPATRPRSYEHRQKELEMLEALGTQV